VFNPSSSCAATAQQQKRRHLDLNQQQSKFLFYLVFKTKFQEGQRGKNLKESGRCKKVTIHRQMGELEMKNTILREFSYISSFTSFVFLECEANNILKLSAHELTGGIAVEKRGALYLCEKR